MVGGLVVLLFLAGMWYIFGAPSPPGRSVRNFIALLSIGIGCILYGVYLRFIEAPEAAREPSSPGQDNTSPSVLTAKIFGKKRIDGLERKHAPAMPFGNPLSDNERRDFEAAWRPLLEGRPFDEIEDVLRQSILRVGDPILKTALEKPVEQVSIDGLPDFAMAIESARHTLPEEKMDKPWGSMIWSLVHRNDPDSDMTILIKFALDSESEPPDYSWPPKLKTEEQKAEWLKHVNAMGRLPERPHFHSDTSQGKVRLLGLDELLPVYNRRPFKGEPWNQQTFDTIDGSNTLASALVALRFCQAAERALTSVKIDPPLSTYLTVDSAARPMETSTVDYCIHFVRRLDVK
jgi:hypothetical protein